MKTKETNPRWVGTLRALMEARGYNPRSLSLKAGLNATAVRDILEGRAKYPRYDTIKALAGILQVTPDDLMNATPRDVLRKKPITSGEQPTFDTMATMPDDLELLTSIISKLQEVATEYKQQIKPKDFAAMVTTIYSHVQDHDSSGEEQSLSSSINHLMTYERLRKQSGG